MGTLYDTLCSHIHELITNCMWYLLWIFLAILDRTRCYHKDTSIFICININYRYLYHTQIQNYSKLWSKARLSNYLAIAISKKNNVKNFSDFRLINLLSHALKIYLKNNNPWENLHKMWSTHGKYPIRV